MPADAQSSCGGHQRQRYNRHATNICAIYLLQTIGTTTLVPRLKRPLSAPVVAAPATTAGVAARHAQSDAPRSHRQPGNRENLATGHAASALQDSRRACVDWRGAWQAPLVRRSIPPLPFYS
eukprot:365747-Chlamydomonas_euryale.AAC.9